MEDESEEIGYIFEREWIRKMEDSERARIYSGE